MSALGQKRTLGKVRVLLDDLVRLGGGLRNCEAPIPTYKSHYDGGTTNAAHRGGVNSAPRRAKLLPSPAARVCYCLATPNG